MSGSDESEAPDCLYCGRQGWFNTFACCSYCNDRMLSSAAIYKAERAVVKAAVAWVDGIDKGFKAIIESGSLAGDLLAAVDRLARLRGAT